MDNDTAQDFTPTPRKELPEYVGGDMRVMFDTTTHGKVFVSGGEDELAARYEQLVGYDAYIAPGAKIARNAGSTLVVAGIALFILIWVVHVSTTLRLVGMGGGVVLATMGMMSVMVAMYGWSVSMCKSHAESIMTDLAHGRMPNVDLPTEHSWSVLNDIEVTDNDDIESDDE